MLCSNGFMNHITFALYLSACHIEPQENISEYSIYVNTFTHIYSFYLDETVVNNIVRLSGIFSCNVVCGECVEIFF